MLSNTIVCPINETTSCCYFSSYVALSAIPYMNSAIVDVLSLSGCSSGNVSIAADEDNKNGRPY